jgi:hypothetical protein
VKVRFQIVVVLLFLHRPALADVFLNKVEVASTSTDKLLNVLSSSVAPGGDRNVVLNGSEFSVRRVVNPEGDGGAFYRYWSDLSENEVDVVKRAESLVGQLSFDRLDALLQQRPPLLPIEENLSTVLEAADEVASRHAAFISSAVSKHIESAFAYETLQWRGIARIPVRALSPVSPLGELSIEDGFILLSEKIPESQASSAFWFIRFNDGFNLIDMFREYDGDAPGEPAYIPKFPLSKRTMTFHEDANKWFSSSWSYESAGSLESHVRHYRDNHIELGFKPMSNALHGENYALLQFRNNRFESIVFIERVGVNAMVTLQKRGVYSQ